jgi:hypothetical protein
MGRIRFLFLKPADPPAQGRKPAATSGSAEGKSTPMEKPYTACMDWWGKLPYKLTDSE